MATGVKATAVAPIVAAFLFGAATTCFADPMIVISKRVTASTSDAHQNSGGTVSTSSSSVSMGSQLWIGMRFQSLAIPAGATITKAYVTFQSTGAYSASASETIFCQAIDSATAFSTSSNNISTRTRTSASVSWTPGSWSNNVTYNTPDISNVVQEVVDRPGWASGNHLAVLIRSDSSGTRSADSYDGSTSNCPLLYIEYTPFSRPLAPNLLFVVTSTSSPTAQEAIREEWLKWWAYNVTRIAAGSSQSSFNTAVAANDVVYVSEQITSTDLNTKLKGAAIGVVNEEPALTDDFGVSTSYGSTSGTSLAITDNSHYITAPFSLGSVALFSSNQPSLEVAGTLAKEAVYLGTGPGGSRSLVAIEAGAILSDSSTAAGRRVTMPFGGNGMDFNTIMTNGLTILKRSIEWASGLRGWWKLDESSGTTASDSSGVGNNGSLINGLSFTSNSISPAKLGKGLNFDGSNDYISIPNAPSFQPTSALSMSAWIKGDSWGSGTEADAILRKGGANPNNYQLAICDGRIALMLDDSDGGGIRGTTVLSTGVWYHVAATWDGATAKIYLNGVLDNGSGTARSGTIGTDTQVLNMGGRSGSTDCFDGVLDDVRFFNYAIGGTEVNNLKGLGQAKGVRIVKWVEAQ